MSHYGVAAEVEMKQMQSGSSN